MRWIHYLAKMITLDPANQKKTGLLVFRAAEAPAMEGAYEKKIMELADGRPTDEIIEILYQEEVSAGAWEADIGLWKGLFSKSVMDIIVNLAQRGYIWLQPTTAGIEATTEEPEDQEISSAMDSSPQTPASLKQQTPPPSQLGCVYVARELPSFWHPGQSPT